MRATSHRRNGATRTQWGLTASKDWLRKTRNRSHQEPGTPKGARAKAVEAMYKDPNLSVKLDAEDLRLVKELAAREKLTKSELVRRVIRKVAREAGLLPPKDTSVL